MSHLDYLNKNYPIRKNTSQKKAFREYIISSLYEKGIKATVEVTKNKKNENVVVCTPESAKVVFTAHYDTPATSIVPNLMLPKNIVLLYLFHFLPIIAILTVSLLPALLISEATGIELLYPVIFLVLYFGLFYTLYFAFTNKNNYNDNTSGVATLLEIIDSLPPERLADFAFIFFDNEEKGKLGSKAYYKDHKDFMKNKLVINFDCVGNGDNILFVSQKAARECAEYKTFKESFKSNESYSVSYHKTSNSAGNSDHKSFPLGVLCMACSKTKNGILYTARIHTNKDTKVKNENILFLSEEVIKYTEKI